MAKRSRLAGRERSGGVALSKRLLATAPLFAPLKSSAVLERGTGNPTFTRATAKRIVDHEGILRTLKSGEIGFTGARRVENLFAGSSENLAATGWGLAGGATRSQNAVAPDGTVTAWTIGVAAALDEINNLTSYQTANKAFLCNLWLKGTGTISIRLSNNVDQQFVTQLTLSQEWQQFSSNVNTANGTSGQQLTGFFRNTGDTATSFVMWRPQIEDVTGQSDQSAAEYVSVGVASSPAYHGSMVDGVKCFQTTLAGAAIPDSTLLGYNAEPAATNICLQSNAFNTTWTVGGTPTLTQNAVGPDGVANSAWTITDDNAIDAEDIRQTFALSATTYTASIFVKKTTGVQASYPLFIALTLTGNYYASCTIDTSNGIATIWTAFTGFTITTSSAKCEDFNDDYWRVSLTFLSTAENWLLLFKSAGTTNAAQSTGTQDDAAQGSAVIFGAQVELGSVATSYIPTTTIAVQRNADVLTYPSAGNASWAAGSFVAEVTAYARGTSHYVIQADDGTNSNRVWISSPDANGNRTFASTGGGSIAMPSTYAVGVLSKIGCSWKTAGQMNTFMDGSAGAGTAYTTPAGTLSTIRIGTNQIVANLELRGNIKNVRIWQTQLSDAILQGITA